MRPAYGQHKARSQRKHAAHWVQITSKSQSDHAEINNVHFGILATKAKIKSKLIGKTTVKQKQHLKSEN